VADEPGGNDAKIYMEICASLMTHFGETEVEINLSDVPNKPFQLWRRFDGEILVVRLVWEDAPLQSGQ